MPPIRILPETLQKSFDLPPVLNSQERIRYGYFPKTIQDLADEIRTPHNRLGFLLQYYYFQISRRFFPVESFHASDIKTVSTKIGVSPMEIKFYLGATVKRHRKLIIESSGFRRIDTEIRENLQTIASEQCRKQIRPRLIFGELSDWLFEQKIEGLSYYPLAKIVTESINEYENSIEHELAMHLTEKSKTALDIFVGIPQKVVGDTDSNEEDNSPLLEQYVEICVECIESNIEEYQVVAPPEFRFLTNFSQSRSRTGIVENCAKLSKTISFLKDLPPSKLLKLSPETIRYYAEAVLSFDTHQMVRRGTNRHLFLYCFLVHQHRIFQDILIDTIMFTCQGRQNIWVKQKEEHIIQSYEYRRIEAERNKKRLLELKQYKQSTAQIIKDKTLALHKKQELLMAILANDEALALAAEELAINEPLPEKPVELKSYSFEEKDSRYFQDKVSGPLKLFEFDKASSESALFEAVEHFKQKNGAVTGTAPMRFLADKEVQELWDEKRKFRVSLYKVFLFKAVIKGIKSGRLNLVESYKYRSLESYLIEIERWIRDKDKILKEAGLSQFASPKPVLDRLREELFVQRNRTEQNLANGTNKKAYLDDKNKVIIETPPVVTDRQNSLSEFFPDQSSVSLFEMLSTVESKASFTQNFEHQYNKNVKKQQPSLTALFAGIIGYGCNIGIPQMGQMLKSVSREELDYASQWYFSPENIENANNAVLALTESMQLSKVYRKDPSKSHTSSDGQKVTVAVESLHANYSHKYFGTQMGVSIYSFIDEDHKLYHSTVMVPSEREATFMIDGLLANELVKSTTHSTDTHGYSEINFAITHFLDISFAPRIKNVKAQQIYKFESAAEANREGWKMMTAGNINTDLIEEQWDAILRFVATIKLHEAQAAELFKRLNSQSLQHPLYAALKQFGRIIKSIFLLKYIKIY